MAECTFGLIQLMPAWADSNSHLYEGFKRWISCCLSAGFALQENIIREEAGINTTLEAYMQTWGTSYMLWGEAER